jgi:pimeloyl-ACP methyl ester carboxylesterase
MSNPTESTALVNGHPCRIWAAGSGNPVVVVPGIGGYASWVPFLDALSADHRVVVLSPPGFPGSNGHNELVGHLDWVIALLDLLDSAVDGPINLIGISVGAALAADIAAVQAGAVRRLVLVGPLGIFDQDDQVVDLWAEAPKTWSSLLCRDPKAWAGSRVARGDLDPIERELAEVRAREAAARLLWPLNDTGVARRLHRITAPTLIVHGSDDPLVGECAIKAFSAGIKGPVEIEVRDRARHLVDLDEPAWLAGRVTRFLSE